jgi:superfamily II DNA/RNA helicase
VCRGQQDLKEMFKTKEYELFKELRPDVHIFALSSDFGMVNDGKFIPKPVTNIKKYDMLKKLKELRSDEEALIFHVDMIGEGIDVPGITGVIPFRNCEMSKFIQNIGRAARLHPYDRKRFYEGEINPGIIEKYVKPYSWIILPTFLINSEGFADRFKSIIWKLRGEYGINKETVLINNDKGFSDEEVIDVDNGIEKKKKHTKSGIEGFNHEFEDMSLVEKIIWNQEQMIESSKHWEKVQDAKKDIINDIL